MPLVIVRYPKRQIRSLQYFLQEKNNLVLGGIFCFRLWLVIALFDRLLLRLTSVSCISSANSPGFAAATVRFHVGESNSQPLRIKLIASRFRQVSAT